MRDTGLTEEEQEEYPQEPEEDLGPQKLPTFQEIVNVLRKYIPEEDRPWDTVDYEEVKEGAPYPEKPPEQKPPPSENGATLPVFSRRPWIIFRSRSCPGRPASSKV